MTPEERLADVIEIMAKARALLDATPDDEDEGEVTEAEYAEAEG